MKLLQLLITFLLLCLPIKAFASSKEEALDYAPSTASVLRAGNGVVDVAGPWPDGSSLKNKVNEGLYSVARLDDKRFPLPSSQILDSWAPENFTSLDQLKTDDCLQRFRFVVHSLELESFIEALDIERFDKFVKNRFNAEVPQGDDFIRFYPFFFHKGTIIRASVATEQLPQTFGSTGFILEVPPSNLLFASEQEAYTPTSEYCYLRGASGFCSWGERSAVQLRERHPLGSLKEFIDSCIRNSKPRDSHREDMQDKLLRREVMRICKERKLKSSNQTIVTEAQEQAQKLWNLESRSCAPEESEKPPAKRLRLVYETPACNEVALMPRRPIDESIITVKITGIFLKTRKGNLDSFLDKPDTKKLMEVAEAFDLPVVLIDNDD